MTDFGGDKLFCPFISCFSNNCCACGVHCCWFCLLWIQQSEMHTGYVFCPMPGSLKAVGRAPQTGLHLRTEVNSGGL